MDDEEDIDHLKEFKAQGKSLSTNHTTWARKEGQWVRVSGTEFNAGRVERPVPEPTTCRAVRAEQKAKREEFYAMCRRQIAEADPGLSAEKLARIIGCSADFVTKARAERARSSDQ